MASLLVDEPGGRLTLPPPASAGGRSQARKRPRPQVGWTHQRRGLTVPAQPDEGRPKALCARRCHIAQALCSASVGQLREPLSGEDRAAGPDDGAPPESHGRGRPTRAKLGLEGQSGGPEFAAGPSRNDVLSGNSEMESPRAMSAAAKEKSAIGCLCEGKRTSGRPVSGSASTAAPASPSHPQSFPIVQQRLSRAADLPGRSGWLHRACEFRNRQPAGARDALEAGPQPAKQGIPRLGAYSPPERRVSAIDGRDLVDRSPDHERRAAVGASSSSATIKHPSGAATSLPEGLPPTLTPTTARSSCAMSGSSPAPNDRFPRLAGGSGRQRSVPGGEVRQYLRPLPRASLTRAAIARRTARPGEISSACSSYSQGRGHVARSRGRVRWVEARRGRSARRPAED